MSTDIQTLATPAFRYDLLVLYAEADAERVRNDLIPAFGLPRTRILLLDDLVPGALILEEVARAVSQSALTVLCMSPDFLSERWAMLGEQLASHAYGTTGKVVPLLLRECELPLRLSALVALDFRERESWPCETARLLQHLGITSQPPPAHSRPPRRRRMFIGAAAVAGAATLSAIGGWLGMGSETTGGAAATAPSAALTARKALEEHQLAFTSERFLQAAQTEDLYAVELYLAAGMSQDKVLPEVVDKRLVRVLEICGRYPARVEALGAALVRAASNGDSAVLDMVLAMKPDLTRYGSRAIYIAAYYNHPEISKHLIEHGVKIRPEDHDVRRSMRYAVSRSSDALVTTLLRAGADPNATDDQPPLVLCYAAYDLTPIARLLLEAGAQANARGRDGNTALLLAAGRNSPAAVALLLEHGADPSAANQDGTTPLMYSVSAIESTRLLLRAGADPHAKDTLGRNALRHAINAGQPEVVELLLASGVTVKETAAQGVTALVAAREYGVDPKRPREIQPVARAMLTILERKRPR